MRIRAAVVAAILVGVVTIGASGCAATGDAAFRVTGYAETGATTSAQVRASHKAMTMVGVDGVNLTADGAGVGATSAASLRLLAEARHLHKSAELLFGNFSNTLGDFDPKLAARMLNSASDRRSVVSALAHDVRSQHWNGITIDLESLNNFGAPGHTRDDNAGLVTFVRQLRAALGSASISICISATTGSYKNLGYDLSDLGAVVNHVVLMAYDQHGPTWSKAGPVGGYPWVRSSLHGLTSTLPASIIQLGIGEWGYSWPTQGTGTNYSVAAVRALVARDRVTAHWNATQREWYATLRNGTVLWWSDARSFAAREALAKAQHLGGVAVWSLGQSDPIG